MEAKHFRKQTDKECKESSKLSILRQKNRSDQFRRNDDSDQRKNVFKQDIGVYKIGIFIIVEIQACHLPKDDEYHRQDGIEQNHLFFVDGKGRSFPYQKQGCDRKG
jgi:hypothetical protein